MLLNDLNIPLQVKRITTGISAMLAKDSILETKYPAKAHCERVAAYLKSKSKHEGPSRIYLQGQKTRIIEDNDEPQPFRFAGPEQ